LSHSLGQSALELRQPGTSTTTTNTGSQVDTGDGTTSDGSSVDTTDNVDTGLQDTGSTSVTRTTPGSTATSDFTQNLYNTIFHPKVLGMLFLMVIATVTIAFLAKSYE
jgi:hypothetical protein